MIFPSECKYIGSAATKPHGDTVYFLTKYLIHPVPEGFEILEVEHAGESGYMRPVKSVRQLVGPNDIAVWEGPITPHDRVGLIRKALSTGKRCTIFGAQDEHMTFVLDPDFAGLETVHVYDIKPPRPNLSATIHILEDLGFFGQQNIMFDHHVRDISEIPADVYPCRAGGFPKTLDRDELQGGEHIACCVTGRHICSECYEDEFVYEDTCPLSQIAEEPFIARCCRADRSGIGIYNGKFGAVVHWGSSPRTMLEAVDAMLEEWHKRKEETHG
ncbi:DUF7714 family protein [Methanorbis rubei]|uniref:Uncharacterized protein n=1 Tax=Methanorbis rubei TaxID=3028300 RepID=A0AAE4MG45_9EURY|nr:hypothetical protein [Methanocorpusculaceae archaeon Cs1]